LLLLLCAEEGDQALQAGLGSRQWQYPATAAATTSRSTHDNLLLLPLQLLRLLHCPSCPYVRPLCRLKGAAATHTTSCCSCRMRPFLPSLLLLLLCQAACGDACTLRHEPPLKGTTPTGTTTRSRSHRRCCRRCCCCCWRLSHQCWCWCRCCPTPLSRAWWAWWGGESVTHGSSSIFLKGKCC
jgi:hypothetical protein